jgi:hypothetical protein
MNRQEKASAIGKQHGWFDICGKGPLKSEQQNEEEVYLFHANHYAPR